MQEKTQEQIQEKKDILQKVNYDKALRLYKGLFIHNYKELSDQLKIHSNKEFEEQLKKEEIASWITENYRDKTLGEAIKKATSKNQIIKLIDQRIKEQKKQNTKNEAKTDTLGKYGNTILIALLLGILIFFFQYTYFSNNGEYKNEKIDMKNQIYQLENKISGYLETIDYLEQQNAELRRRFDQKLKDEQIIIPIEEEKPSPKDRINLTRIRMTEETVTFLINDPQIAEFTKTGSMLPTLSSTATAIQTIPKKPEDISPGDIISYKIKENEIIIHRVIDIGIDPKGWYAQTKGDNNPLPDKEKVRFDQIQRVLVAIIY